MDKVGGRKKSASSRNRSALLREPDTPARSGHFTASFIRSGRKDIKEGDNDDLLTIV
jgi:hypothetical protein